MPDLSFRIQQAEAVAAAATPAITLGLEVSSGEPVETILLHSQVRIEAPRRRYTDPEKARLRDVFGEPERWGQSLRPLFWTNITTTVPAFTGSIGFQLAVPCTFDFDVAATKYFHALGDDPVPIILLFSGTVFYRNAINQIQAAPIPWSSEARFALPTAVWRRSLDLHHPNTAWLALRRDVFDRLNEFKVRRGLATFDAAVERMLSGAMEVGA